MGSNGSGAQRGVAGAGSRCIRAVVAPGAVVGHGPLVGLQLAGRDRVGRADLDQQVVERVVAVTAVDAEVIDLRSAPDAGRRGRAARRAGYFRGLRVRPIAVGACLLVVVGRLTGGRFPSLLGVDGGKSRRAALS